MEIVFDISRSAGDAVIALQRTAITALVLASSGSAWAAGQTHYSTGTAWSAGTLKRSDGTQWITV